jgi:hypothetical protein
VKHKPTIEELKQIAISRQKGHKGSKPLYAKRLNDKDPYREVIVGLLGEVCFGEKYNLEADLKFRPKGDNHIDFKIKIDGKRIVTLDIKTTTNPTKLLIKEWEINKCSDILILAHYKNENDIKFIGWTTKKIMKNQPKEVTSKILNITNYYIYKDNLYKMDLLDDLFNNYKIEQIIPD